MKILFEIKHRFSAKVLFSIEAETMRQAVEKAVEAETDLSYADLSYANLSSANLSSANLSSADLRSANLRSANLSSADLRYALNLRLPTGETWAEYLTKTLPALLTAGGKALESFAASWNCHDWNNCPMAHAFDVRGLANVPILFRPRAKQFVQLFDANQIPWPLPTKDQLAAQAAEAAEKWELERGKQR